MQEEPSYSPTEDKIQQLLAERFTASEERKAQIDEEIAALKATDEGQADQEKHNRMARNSSADSE